MSAVPVVALPDPVSEAEKEVDAVGVWHVGEHFVHPSEGGDVLAPKLPIALPLVVIRSHDPSVDVFPRSSEKIRELSLSLKRKTLHEAFCSGKESAKRCKKSSSEILNVVADAELRLKVRDNRSAMVLSTPAMDTEMSGDASLAWILKAKARVRRPAMAERDELNLLVQLTVGVLSHQAATWTGFSDTRCSSTK